MNRLLLLPLCVLCSCGTAKRSTETDKHLSTNINFSDTLFRKDSVFSIEQLLLNERLKAHIAIVEWSKPDSSGNQYPIKTTDVDISRDKTEQSSKTEQVVSTADRIKKEGVQQEVKNTKKENVKTDTRFIPTLVWWFLVVGGVIAALLMWFSRRKK